MKASSEYFEYRIPSKFIGEIQIGLSCLIIVGAVVSITAFCVDLDSIDGHAKDTAIGFITYSSVILLLGITDIVFGIVLISSTNQISLPQCLLWRGSSVTSLILLALLTLAFLMLLKQPHLLLGFLPTLIFKPFALWVVKGYINELRLLIHFPSTPTATLPPGKPAFSLQDPRSLKRSTTIFVNKREFSPSKAQPPTAFIITSKITPIPDDPR